MKAVLEDKQLENHHRRPRGNGTKIEAPAFLKEIITGSAAKTRIGMINMEDDDVSEWTSYGETIPVLLDPVSELFKWKDLFPEWIDEEEESDVPLCPEIPMPEYENYEEMDVVVVKMPCRFPEEGWNRDIRRLQVHLAAANMAVRKGKRRVKVVVQSQCRPMLEIFRCEDLMKREGEWWVFEPEMRRLEQKMSLPVGSCRLALPLWGQGMLPVRA